MDTDRFDRLTRTFSQALSRRGLAGALGLAAVALPGLAAARKKKKKIKRNSFGCVNVGKACRGKDSNCCSGICKGKKPKKGKKDKSECVGHDEGGCRAGQTILDCGGVDVACTSSSGEEGECFTTTGNAGYCFTSGDCFPCTKDADCVAVCGAQAACVVCAGECAADGGTACVGPSETSCGMAP